MTGKKEMAVYSRSQVAIEGEFVGNVAPQLVRVMARAEGYAMVRLPGCIPVVVREKQLTPATGAEQ